MGSEVAGSSGHQSGRSTLPLVDLHLHQERSARLNQVLAVRGREDLVDWSAWLTTLRARTPPGIARLMELWGHVPTPFEYDTSDVTLLRLQAVLLEAAAAGAVLAEVRVGNETILRPGLVEMFREAEDHVQVSYPTFRAGLVVIIKLWHEKEELAATLNACLSASTDGPGGVDLLYLPYELEADWRLAYRFAEQIAASGLGLTAHAGEFSASNVAAALRLPGLSRLGHAVHAAYDRHLLDQVLASGVAVECCLTSNLVLGAVHSVRDHPIVTLRDAGVPVVLGTDNPLQFGTTIGREYSLAGSLGLTTEDLADVSREAISRSFVPSQVKAELLTLEDLNGWRVAYD